MRQRYKGYTMAILGSTFWGIGGVVTQTLFAQYRFTSDYLVPLRMLCAGLLFLCITQLRTRQNVTAIWREKSSLISLFLFAIIGMIGAQYSFFSGIQVGNAATATLLQSLCPLVTMVYLAFKWKQIPSARSLVALFIAILGVYLLVTNGSVHKLSISTAAVFWGLINAVFLSFNTMQPQRLFEKWGSAVVLGWGMLIGSVVLALVTHPWAYTDSILWTKTSVVSVAFVIVVGTVLPFYLFLDSVRLITATEASLISNVEPLVAVIVSVTWLHLHMHLVEGIGALLVIITVLLLSVPKRKQTKEPANANARNTGTT